MKKPLHATDAVVNTIFEPNLAHTFFFSLAADVG